MLNRYHKPPCRVCGNNAHFETEQFFGYNDPQPQVIKEAKKTSKRYYCKAHLPDAVRERLNIEWQMTHIVFPLSDVLDRLIKKRW